MNIKELRSKTGLSQKEFGTRLGVTSQSITKYEAGGKITETIKKLIRYEFAEYLPEEERLTVKKVPAGEETAELQELREKNAVLEDQVKEVSHLKEQNSLLKRTVELLEDQVQLYKEKLEINTGSNRPA